MSLRIADREQYIMVNLGAIIATPILPIPHPFLDGRSYDGRIYQSQWRPSAWHVAVAGSPAVHQSVTLSRVIFCD